MEKVLRLQLNKYARIPRGLQSVAGTGSSPTVTVNLASLYHHYYLDTHGRGPPSPDPAHFEHVQFLLPTADFRFQGDGLGASTTARRSKSTELGQAFCRWFLHDHLNITYFAHMSEILRRQQHRRFRAFKVERTVQGDVPDYFCAESIHRVFLAEAKGRYSAVSFRNKEFASWRRQFDRVMVRDSTGAARSVKGHIVATRFATEMSSARLQSTLFAEDPETMGDAALGDNAGELGAAIVAAHYGRISTKLGQPVLAAALETGVAIPNELRILAIAWTVQASPLAGVRFVGGYFGDGVRPLQTSSGEIRLVQSNALRLDAPRATFFGVEENVFRELVAHARSGAVDADRAEWVPSVRRFEEITPFYSAFSVLRDGSVLAPLDFFLPVEEVAY